MFEGRMLFALYVYNCIHGFVGFICAVRYTVKTKKIGENRG